MHTLYASVKGFLRKSTFKSLSSPYIFVIFFSFFKVVFCLFVNMGCPNFQGNDSRWGVYQKRKRTCLSMATHIKHWVLPCLFEIPLCFRGKWPYWQASVRKHHPIEWTKMAKNDEDFSIKLLRQSLRNICGGNTSEEESEE